VSEVSRSSASEPSQRPTAQRASVPTTTPIAAKKPGPPGRRLSARHVNVQPAAALVPRRLVPRTLNHDANGNRVAESSSGVTKTFDHDAQGTLRGATVGGVAISYVVDGAARRLARLEGGVTTHQWLFRDDLQVAAELDGAGALRWRFVYATGKHVPDAAIDAAGVVYRLVTDQVGSLRLVVRASDGSVMQRMRHDAWGAVEEDFVAAGFARVPFAHERNSAGGLVDQVTGLVLSVHTNSGAREYDPVAGRWVEKDPIGFEGGTTGLYEYCSGSPAACTDPSGLFSPGFACGLCTPSITVGVGACILLCVGTVAAANVGPVPGKPPVPPQVAAAVCLGLCVAGAFPADAVCQSACGRPPPPSAGPHPAPAPAPCPPGSAP
jgi:RHS repeat-associated protein